jgi:glycerol uptake facilitator-like aquaporin
LDLSDPTLVDVATLEFVLEFVDVATLSLIVLLFVCFTEIMDYLNLLEPAHYAEIFGTFVFLSGILRAGSENATLKLSAALTLCAFVVGDISGGHMNPAVSSMFFLQGTQNEQAKTKLLWYAGCQLAGGVLAHVVDSLFHGLPQNTKGYSHSFVQACVAEVVGTVIFFMGILSNGGNMFVVGLSLYIAANVVGGVSGGHLNPAVTFMMLLRGQIDLIRAGAYIVCQLVGAYCTLQLHAKLHA